MCIKKKKWKWSSVSSSTPARSIIYDAHGGGRMVSASGSETSVSNSMPASAIIYDAYTSIIYDACTSTIKKSDVNNGAKHMRWSARFARKRTF